MIEVSKDIKEEFKIAQLEIQAHLKEEIIQDKALGYLLSIFQTFKKEGWK